MFRSISEIDDPERILTLLRLLWFSEISAIALFQLQNGFPDIEFLKYLVFKSAEESVSEFVNGLLTLLP